MPFYDEDGNPSEGVKKAHANRTAKREQRQTEWVEEFKLHGSVKKANLVCNVPPATYRSWRYKDPKFGALVDSIRETHDFPYASSNWLKDMGHSEWVEAGFAKFRKRWFHTDTPPFQQQVISAYENTEPGKITMILMPPEHGKTTLFEDYAAWKLATDPSYRFTVGSESQSMSRKILRRVKQRLDPDGPFPDFVEMFGPFVPQTASQRDSKGDGKSTSKTRQPWGQDYFNVYKKGGHDERDYSMTALGIGSQIAGTRTDHLHIDDVMSLNNLNQAKAILETIRQDWLSRPGQRGRTTINGTRVGLDDVYELIEEAFDDDLLNIIRMPAITTDPITREKVPLWPYNENTKWGWTMEMLDRQRRTVGEEAWERNYMQRATARGEQTFTKEVVEGAINPLRSLTHTTPSSADGPFYIGIDPSIGGVNCFSLIQAGDKLKLWDIREDHGLASNQVIAQILEQLIRKVQGWGCFVSDVVIEEMAFQKGLMQDDAFIALRKQYGFAMRGHTTGSNKYDPNFGIASMVHHMAKGDIDLAGADDTYTRKVLNEFSNELYRWRKLKRGTRLVQDRVMAFWFVYIIWMQRYRASGQPGRPGRKPWQGPGLGYAATEGRVLTKGPYAA